MEFNFWAEVFVPYILPALGVLITGLITWLTTTIVSWINEKIKDKKVASMLTFITNAVTNAVKTVHQTYVENIKGTDGWTKEVQLEALNRALELAKSQLTVEARKFIEEYFGDLNNYLLNLIEAILYNLKNGKPATTKLHIEK